MTMEQFDVRLLQQADQCATACRNFVRRNKEGEVIQLLSSWAEKLVKAQRKNDAPGICLYQMAMLGLIHSMESAKEQP